MRIFLSISFLFLFLFLASFAGTFPVHCYIDNQTDQTVIICSTDDEQGGGEGDENYMTEEDCQSVKDLTGTELTSAASLVREIDQLYFQSLVSKLSAINTANHNIRLQAESIELDQPEVSYNIITNVDLINIKLIEIESTVSQVHDECVGVESSIQMALAEVQGYNCKGGQTCSGSGSGSVECPCQEEFNKLLVEVQHCKDELVSMLPSVTSNALYLAHISSVVDLWEDALNTITNRLNAPDDRMWGELDEIYTGLYTNMVAVSTNSLDLSSLFYSLKQLVRGDAEQRGPLHISTEGIVSLYGSVFSMANAVQNNKSIMDFHDTVVFFSNTVHRLFDDYNRITTLGNHYIPAVGKYPYIYNVFTNSSSDARARYATLTSPFFVSATNWYQRMELYQQAALGWFDNIPLTEEEDQQDRYTESSIEYSLNNTTNNLGLVNEEGGHLITNASRVVYSLIGEVAGVQISASCPTLITLLPEIDIGNITDFGPITWDTTESQDLINVARKVTSLVWRVSFWVLYVIVGYGLGRVVFVLILFIVNLAKHL